jgi:hypothetical protein
MLSVGMGLAYETGNKQGPQLAFASAGKISWGYDADDWLAGVLVSADLFNSSDSLSDPNISMWLSGFLNVFIGIRV